jgi:hypothetical protein
MSTQHIAFLLLAEKNKEKAGVKESEEDSKEESEEGASMRTAQAKAATKKAPAAPAKPAAVDDYDEIPWIPLHNHHTYCANGFNRYQFVIDMPSSFTGKKGTYNVSIENEGTELALKLPISEVFTDPHSIHSLLLDEFHRTFSDDSAKVKAFKDASKHMKGKMSVFRFELDFPCRKSVAEDLMHRGKLFRKIEKNGVMVAVLILELKSVHRVDDESDSDDEDLSTATTFKSPPKKVGVHGDLAQKARVLEIYMNECNASLPQVRAKLKREGVEIDDTMEIDDVFKKAKPAAAPRRKLRAKTPPPPPPEYLPPLPSDDSNGDTDGDGHSRM